MDDGAKVFGMLASEAVALYLAAITTLGMMDNEGLVHHGRDTLEDAAMRWHAFCTKRGIELPSPKDAMKSLKASTEIKIL